MAVAGRNTGFGMGGDRAGLVGAVERVRHQDRRAAGSAFGPALGRDSGQEQALAGAVQDQHLGRRIDRAGQGKSAPEPGRGGVAELVEPLVHGVFAEFVERGGQDWANERRHPVLRLAHGQADSGLARRLVGQELAQAHEWRAHGEGPVGRGR